MTVPCGGPRLLALLAWGALLAGASPTEGQTEGEELETVASELAAAWSLGRTGEFAARMSGEGIRLYLPDASHPVIPVRLARAAIADLHSAAGQGPVTVQQARLLGGDPARAFVEMAWRPLPEGTTEPLHYTVFAGLEEREDGWRVVEIRVIPSEGADAPFRPSRHPIGNDDLGDPWR